MKPPPDVPDLQIVPTDSLQPHERMDAGRLTPLVEALEKEGVLKNPPVVLRIGDRQERYIVLDGANRTAAFRSMGMSHILVQLVHAGDNTVQVETWNHALLGGSTPKFLEIVRRTSGIELLKSDLERAARELGGGGSLAYLARLDGSVWEVAWGGGGLAERVECLNLLVDLYQPDFRVERTSAAAATGLQRLYSDLCCVVVFPRFKVDEVIEVASGGVLFPTGLTRFIVSPRALRVNYPLARLAADVPLESKHRQLAEWVRRLVEERRVRYYAESTFLFDE